MLLYTSFCNTVKSIRQQSLFRDCCCAFNIIYIRIAILEFFCGFVIEMALTDTKLKIHKE